MAPNQAQNPTVEQRLATMALDIKTLLSLAAVQQPPDRTRDTTTTVTNNKEVQDGDISCRLSRSPSSRFPWKCRMITTGDPVRLMSCNNGGRGVFYVCVWISIF